MVLPKTITITKTIPIMAREMRLKVFQVDQALEIMRVALVTILAREMRLKIFEVDHASFGDVASGAGHDIGARNAIEIFEVDKCLEMLRVSLVTILARAREMRLKFFEVDQASEMLRVPLVTILAQEMRLEIF